jgi:hypothetical protein
MALHKNSWIMDVTLQLSTFTVGKRMAIEPLMYALNRNSTGGLIIA